MFQRSIIAFIYIHFLYSEEQQMFSLPEVFKYILMTVAFMKKKIVSLICFFFVSNIIYVLYFNFAESEMK